MALNASSAGLSKLLPCGGPTVRAEVEHVEQSLIHPVIVAIYLIVLNAFAEADKRIQGSLKLVKATECAVIEPHLFQFSDDVKRFVRMGLGLSPLGVPLRCHSLIRPITVTPLPACRSAHTPC